MLGVGITEMAPGSQKGLQVVVEDAEKMRDELRSRGVDASDVDKQPWGWFTYFSDPDGNTWAAQQMVPQTWLSGAHGDRAAALGLVLGYIT